METTNLISYGEYIIDTEHLTYKAVWNCQVEWTDECIYYDAETGRVELEEGEVEFISEHQHKVTKHEYHAHVNEARSLPTLAYDELKERFQYRQVI